MPGIENLLCLFHARYREPSLPTTFFQGCVFLELNGTSELVKYFLIARAQFIRVFVLVRTPISYLQLPLSIPIPSLFPLSLPKVAEAFE